MSAHTKGPWVLDARMSSQGFWRVLGLTSVPWSANTPEYHVANVIDANDSAQNVANARLIAAAPDLLAALEAAEQCIGELPPTQARVEAMQMIQAAIAQAKGEK